MNVPKKLVEAIAQGDAVLLVGAGLSMGAGLPGWADLLAPLAGEIGMPAERREDLLQVAQDYVDAHNGSRQPLLDHLRRQTRTTGREPTDNHLRLARLGIRTWVTTNYDDLLEKTLDRTGQHCTQVVRDQNLPYASADAVTLIKLHGDREQPDTIVIGLETQRKAFCCLSTGQTSARGLGPRAFRP